MQLLLGNCLDRLKDLPDNSVDAIVTDPPYGLSFMGKKWDYDVPSEEVWRECFRVLKPGGHLLSFAGTRTQHRMAVRIEDAGFEIRDMIAWIYASGFPKSLNISKAIDKASGAEREVTGTARGHVDSGGVHDDDNYEWKPVYERRDKPATEAAKQWEGWGTALKPALEPITVARKPLIGTVAENVLTHGTGGLNIDGCRVATDDTYTANGMASLGVMHDDNWEPKTISQQMHTQGRFPANLIHDGSEEVVGLFPESKTSRIEKPSDCNTNGTTSFQSMRGNRPARGYDGEGSAARFFYCAKASKKDRDEGLEGFEDKQKVFNGQSSKPSKDMKGVEQKFTTLPKKNHHPTVKPTDLMRYLCRLVTPKGGVVLDPFMGSGSTGKAAKLEGFDFIGIEMDYDYYKIAHARINAVEPTLFAA